MAIHEFVLDRVGPEVNQLAVRQSCQQQVVEHLRSMNFAEIPSGLEFKCRSFANKQIYKIVFNQVVKTDFDPHLCFGTLQTRGKCDSIDVFVKEPSKILMDQKKA